MPFQLATNQEFICGRYRLIRLLGQGGMGAVYLVEDVLDAGKSYALKVLPSKSLQEEAAFRREFAMLAELDHPNIARVYSFGIIPEDGASYYTTDYISGGDFYAIARDRDWQTLMQLAIQSCRALDYLHGRGILHRDLKPDNILIDRDPLGQLCAKLCDFGLAQRGQTVESGFCGSLDYAAPELLKGAAASQRTDIYALGVTLYQAVTGQLPFPAEKLSEAVKHRLEMRPVKPSKVNPDLPLELEEVILKMLEPCPEERPNGARKVAEALASLIQGPFSFDTPETSRAVVHCGYYIETKSELTALKNRTVQFQLSGTGAVVHIKGDYGCGKTRLLSEWRTWCQLEGLAFHTAQAHAGEAFSIFKSWLHQILGEPSQARKSPRFANLLKPYESTLSLLVPNYYTKSVLTEALAWPESSRRIKLHEDLRVVFNDLLSTQVTILVVDDFQQIDPASLEALRYLLQPDDRPPALWAFAFSEDDISTAGSEAEEFLEGEFTTVETTAKGEETPSSLKRMRIPPEEEVVLRGFTEREIKNYFEKVFSGYYPEGPFVEQLLKISGGRPLYIEESLLELMERREIRFESGGWVFPYDINRINLARGFETSLIRRLEIVKEPLRSILHQLALAYASLPVDILPALSKFSPDVVHTYLKYLQRLGLVILEETGKSSFVRLVHYRLAEPLLAEIEPSKLQTWRLEIARALQAEGQPKQWAGEIARQLFQLGKLKLAVDWALQAADFARQSLHNDLASEYYFMSLRAMEQSGASLEAQSRVRLQLCQLENLAGRLNEAIDLVQPFYDEHKDHLDQKSRLRVCENLAAALEKRGDYAEALSLLHEASDLQLPQDRLRNLVNIGWVHYLKGDVQTALDHCNTSLQELINTQDISGQALVHNTLGRIYFFSGNLSPAQEHWHHCLELRQQLGDKRGLADSYNNLGVVYSSLGDPDRARQHFEMALKLSAEVGDLVRRNGLLVNLGIMAYEAGDLDLAQRRYSEALGFLRRSGSDRELLDCLNNLGEICLLRAEFQAARQYWEECLKICAASGFVSGTIEPLTYLGAIHILCNDFVRGEDFLSRAWEAAEGTHALREQAFIKEQQGALALRQRKFEEADSAFTTALAKLGETQVNFLKGRLWLRQAELAWLVGDRERYLSLMRVVQVADSQWLKAESCRIRGLDFRSDQVEEALNQAVELGQPFPELLWRAYWQRGRYYHHRRRFRAAGENYQKAIETLKHIMILIPEDLKASYAHQSDIELLKNNAAQLKTEILAARSQPHVG